MGTEASKLPVVTVRQPPPRDTTPPPLDGRAADCLNKHRASRTRGPQEQEPPRKTPGTPGPGTQRLSPACGLTSGHGPAGRGRPRARGAGHRNADAALVAGETPPTLPDRRRERRCGETPCNSNGQLVTRVSDAHARYLARRGAAAPHFICSRTPWSSGARGQGCPRLEQRGCPCCFLSRSAGSCPPHPFFVALHSFQTLQNKGSRCV